VAAAGASLSRIASRQEGRDGRNRSRREREGERHKERKGMPLMAVYPMFVEGDRGKT
jgi:hypothetical protein